ncbi:MAG: small-conductance mechanosensitive channel [Psychromonas sp.]|jgi:small-conductance mechanosensitive channel|uniref:mechanosensitive ion channel family protein n=1 Tax=Psychromonas sp. TaxID=1884585 RepID=UPI0039E52D6F
MNEIWHYLTDIFNIEYLAKLLRAGLLLILGFIFAKLISYYSTRFSEKVFTLQTAFLIKRLVYHFIFILFVFSALLEMGFNLNVLLGAASVLTVAIGFASQTSASNFISGIFLMAERSFSVGDVIRVGTTVGEVLSIDLLSVKLRTFDNLFVRLPNETLIKSEVTTLTKFPIRRLDLKIGIAYKENIEKVKTILQQVASDNPLSLEEPKPVYIFQGFEDSCLSLQFSVWAKRENFLELKNSIYEQIKIAFDKEEIEIPFPHISLYAGSATEPFPIKITREKNHQNSDK